MAAWFALIVPTHLLARSLGRRDALPPLFLAGIGWIAGLRVTVEGRPHPGALLLANHVSWLDILALAGKSRAIFVAHEGLAGHRFLRWLCEQNSTIFIARSRRGTVNRQVEQLRQALGKRPVVLFPEGTTGDGTNLLPFKSSLLSAVEPLPEGVTVQPVLLAYRDAPDIAWSGGEAGLDNTRRILTRRRPVRLTIRFLQPLRTQALAGRKAMAAAAHEAIQRALAEAGPTGTARSKQPASL